MARYYTYVISSLPSLQFGMKPPYEFTEFLRLLEGLVEQDDIRDLEATASVGSGQAYTGSQPTLRKWHAFDTALRNEIVKIRAAKKKGDPARYLRSDGNEEYSVSHTANNAYRAPSLLEGERIMDTERWRMLEEFSFGHYFDRDALIVYGCKLLILQKWQAIHAADARRLIEQVYREAEGS